MDINNQRVKDGVSLALLGGAFALALWLAVRLIGVGGGTVEAAGAAKSDPVAGSNAAAGALSPEEKIAEELKQKNMFLPPPPKPQPPREVTGIFGNEALVDGKWYKKGETIPQGAKVLEVAATFVKLMWEEKEITLAPIKAASSGESGDRGDRRGSTPGAGRSGRGRGMERGSRPEGLRRSGLRPGGPGGGSGPGRGPGRLQISDEERQRIREETQGMSSEERREYFRDRYGSRERRPGN